MASAEEYLPFAVQAVRLKNSASTSLPYVFLSQDTQKSVWTVLEPRKDLRQIAIAEMAIDHFAYNLAKVSCEGQVASLVELRLFESWPAPVDFAAAHWAAYNEHDISVSVIGATSSILARGTAKLGH